MFISSCRLVISSCQTLISSCCYIIASCCVPNSSCRRVISSSRVFLSLSSCPSGSACMVSQFSLCLYTSQAIARDRLCCLSSLSFSAFLGWLRLPACLIQLFVAKSPGLPLVLFSGGVQSAGLKPSHTSAPD